MRKHRLRPKCPTVSGRGGNAELGLLHLLFGMGSDDARDVPGGTPAAGAAGSDCNAITRGHGGEGGAAQGTTRKLLPWLEDPHMTWGVPALIFARMLVPPWSSPGFIASDVVESFMGTRSQNRPRSNPMG